MAKRDKKSKRRFNSKKLKERTKKSQQNARTGKTVIDASKNVPIIQLGEGKHSIDIIPYIAGKNDVDPGSEAYTFEYYQHRNVGPNPIICPQATFDKPCPICERQQKLRDKGDEKYKEYWPKRRNLYNVVCYDRSQRDKGVQVLDVSWHYLEKFLAKISEKTNRRTGEIETIVFSSPDKEEGRSIDFTIEAPKSENDWPEWIGHQLDRRDYDIDDKILDDAFVLDEIVTILSYDEIKEILYENPNPTSFKKGKKNKDEEKDDADTDDDITSDIDDIESYDDMKKYLEENEINYKLNKKKWRLDADNIKEEVKELMSSTGDDDEDDGDDDDAPKYSKDEIEEMSYKKLKKLIKEEDLDVDIDDFDDDDEDDLEDLRGEVIEELGLDE
jgi:hypothetical protein